MDGQDVFLEYRMAMRYSKTFIRAAPQHPANASRPGNKLPARSPFPGGTFHWVLTTRRRIGLLIGCDVPECITIHVRKTHRSDSERFSGAKCSSFVGEGVKTR